MSLVVCPLCGFRFPGRASCPAGCPLHAACQTLCCPNCHYRFVLTSSLAEKVARWLRGRRP